MAIIIKVKKGKDILNANLILSPKKNNLTIIKVTTIKNDIFYASVEWSKFDASLESIPISRREIRGKVYENITADDVSVIEFS